MDGVDFLPICYDDLNENQLRDDAFYREPAGGRQLWILDDSQLIWKSPALAKFAEELVLIRWNGSKLPRSSLAFNTVLHA